MATIKPSHHRLDDALNLNPFMEEAEEILNSAIDSDDDSDASDYEKYLNYEQKSLLYNTESLGEDRKWLHNTLLSDTESESEISDEEKYVGELLRDHVKQKKIRKEFHQEPTVSSL
jgi:paraquat-inducible protein B